MKLEGEQVLLRVYLDSTETYGMNSAAEAIVQRAHDQDIAGATVIQGIMGLDFEGRLLDAGSQFIADQLPLVIEIVDHVADIGRFLPSIREIVPKAVITLERAHVMLYRQSRVAADHAKAHLEVPGPVPDLSTLPSAEEYPIMKFCEDAQQLRIFIDESDTIEHQPLYRMIVLKARELGMAGATVVKGMMGFGAASRIHSDNLLELSSDLPVMIEIVDAAEKVEKLLPFLDEWIHEGLVTVECVRVIKLRKLAEVHAAAGPAH